MARSDSLDILNTLPAWLSPITDVLVEFPGSHPIAKVVALHVNTAVVPSGTGDGLSSVTSSDELTVGAIAAITAIISVVVSPSLSGYAS